jgi:hypothetical protein
MLVFYVANLGSNGNLCAPGTANRMPVLLINRSCHLPVTVAHELGHALGLVSPDEGHAEGLGYDATNVMSRAADPDIPERRDWLSVAQVFRLVADGSAFVNVSGLRRDPIRYDCRAQDNSDRANQHGDCPPLAVPSWAGRQ